MSSLSRCRGSRSAQLFATDAGQASRRVTLSDRMTFCSSRNLEMRAGDRVENELITCIATRRSTRRCSTPRHASNGCSKAREKIRTAYTA